MDPSPLSCARIPSDRSELWMAGAGTGDSKERSQFFLTTSMFTGNSTSECNFTATLY